MKFYFAHVFLVQDRDRPVSMGPEIRDELSRDNDLFFVSIWYVVKRLNFELRRLGTFLIFFLILMIALLEFLAGFPVEHLLNLIWL